MAKRKQQGNGSGTVYPRRNKDGKITSYLGSYFAPDGKRRYVSAKTKTACRQELRRAMSDADEGFVFDAGKQSVGAYMVRWLEDFAKADLAPRTYHNYKLQIARRSSRRSSGQAHTKSLTSFSLQVRVPRSKLRTA